MELSPDLLRQAHYWMRLTRALDDRGTFLHKQSKIVGGFFSQIGHEAVSVGAALALGPDDVVAPLHRDLGCFLARGITPQRILAQFMGRVGGVSRGRDTNMHGMGDLNFGVVGFISHLPASLPVAVGMAQAFTLKGEPRVAMAFYGDGGSSQGLTHESLNWASVFRLPVVFICENNQYAMSMPVGRGVSAEHISDRAVGYGIPGLLVDGMGPAKAGFIAVATVLVIGVARRNLQLSPRRLVAALVEFTASACSSLRPANISGSSSFFKEFFNF